MADNYKAWKERLASEAKEAVRNLNNAAHGNIHPLSSEESHALGQAYVQARLRNERRYALGMHRLKMSGTTGDFALDKALGFLDKGDVAAALRIMLAHMAGLFDDEQEGR